MSTTHKRSALLSNRRRFALFSVWLLIETGWFVKLTLTRPSYRVISWLNLQGFKTQTNRPMFVVFSLKQAPRAWYSELKTYLTTIGFRNSLSDTSLFILKHNGDYVYLLVYVNDILITGSSPTLIQQIIDAISRKFSIKDMGSLGYFLGIKAIRTPHGLHLMQRKYITDLLTKANMLNAKPVATPLPSSPKLSIK